MKNNKKLQKIANESLNQFHDEEFLQELKSKVGASKRTYNPQKVRLKRFGICLTAVITATVICCVFLLPSTKQEKQYMLEHLTSVASTVEEVNNEMIYYQVSDNFMVTKYYDSQYGDTLYYKLLYAHDNVLNSLQLIVRTNQMFNYNFVHDEYKKNLQFKGHELQYCEELKVEDGLYFFKNKGEIHTNYEIIYIEYDGISLEENSSFLTLISTLLIKNN